jgi:hypothetical protein
MENKDEKEKIIFIMNKNQLNNLKENKEEYKEIRFCCKK